MPLPSEQDLPFQREWLNSINKETPNSQIYTVGNVLIAPLSTDNMVQLMYLSKS